MSEFRCHACGSRYRGARHCESTYEGKYITTTCLCLACYRARNWVEPEVQWAPSPMFGGTWYLRGLGKISTVGPLGYYAMCSHGVSGKPCHTLAEAARWLVKEVQGG
jgi:hypothetical protein